MSDKPLLLMTGAAGNLGTWLRPVLAAEGWRVRLSDLRRPDPLLPNETWVRARLEVARHMRRACAGTGALLHLGGAPTERDWPALITANVTGLTNCLEAARASGVRRIVLASTMHVVGMHPRSVGIDEESVFAPDTRYGATKLFAEGVGRLFAEKYGLAVTALRIGHVMPHVAAAVPGEGIAVADLARLVALVLDDDRPGFRLYHAVAPHPGYPLSDGRLRSELGFTFTEQGPDRATILARIEADPSLAPRARIYRGGHFAGYD
ncbi:MAG: NAD(P)-dependent oxidoreductase [Alteraurantiacibacter sp.]